MMRRLADYLAGRPYRSPAPRRLRPVKAALLPDGMAIVVWRAVTGSLAVSFIAELYAKGVVVGRATAGGDAMDALGAGIALWDAMKEARGCN